MEAYFEDMVENSDGKREIYELTNGEYDRVQVYRRWVYFANLEDDGKIKRSNKRICYVFSIVQDSKYRSMSFPTIFYALLEEMIPPLGQPFLPHEYTRFMNIISTVFRRRDGIVYMIANTNKPVCPYFDEWCITERMLKQGSISVITQHVEEQETTFDVNIAVEYCNSVEGDVKMIFGKKRGVIVGGQWDTRTYPHLPKNMREYRAYYKMYLFDSNHGFVLSLLKERIGGFPFIYVYPYTKKEEELRKKNERIVSNTQSMSYLVTTRIDIMRTKYDKLILKLLREKMVFYSDNMTGTLFEELFSNKF